ncbi:hypothetical protein EDB86DRAFT_3064189 [Lactarius hatsudake]|nr:hypothetical protein EDB86DRAFT_3064189 [Lactarius hatsudake]
MIGHSWPEYVFIRFSVSALRLVAPLSIVYLAASWSAGTFLWSPLFGVYALIESLFFLLVYLPRRSRLQRDAEHPPRMSRAERDALFHNCANSMTPESITNWFIRAPGLRVLRDNVLEEWEEELDYYISVMGNYVGYPIDRGSIPEMQCFRLTFDPVHMVHRPFIWYMIVGLVDALTSTSLYLHGFTHHNTRKWFHSFPPRPLLALFSRSSTDTVTNLLYWYRPHRSSTKLPILFIHGVGIGMYPYTLAFLAVELLPISARITAPPLARDAVCEAIIRILNAHGLHRVVVMGHSYGTVVASYLRTPTASANEPTIAAVLLSDPIPFLLHHPSVAYNFVYRHPCEASEWQIWYFASRDPDTSRALSRHLFWFESILFRQDVVGAGRAGAENKPRVAVSLGGCDQLIDARAVRAYLTGDEEEQQRVGAGPSRWAGDGLEVLYFPEFDHASLFHSRSGRAALLDVLSRFVRQEWAEETSQGKNGTTEGTTLYENGIVDVE